MTTNLSTPNPYPYVGPRHFNKGEQNLFFGREREAQDLYSLVMSERLVLFYAQSGAGKSSLIRARLLPDLVDKQNFIALPIGRVSGNLPEGISKVANIFTFNLINSLIQPKSVNLQSISGLSLTDFLWRFKTVDGEDYDYDEHLSSNYDFTAEPPHILVIDQFEEIVTTHLDRWQDRLPFFQQLNQAMRDDPLLWIILVFREDNLAALTPYTDLLLDGMQAHFYMQRMHTVAARLAIEEPAKLHSRPFARSAADKLLNDLRQLRTSDTNDDCLGEFIEPVQLQVVCLQLWQNLQNRPLAPITTQDLDDLGNVNQALGQFYEQVLKETLQKKGGSEIELRLWFADKLITVAGTRSTVYQDKETTAGLNNAVVKELTDRYLLRYEERAGGKWYELIHDTLIDPIIDANRSWRKKQLPYIQASLAWHDAEHPDALLYQGDQLAEILNDPNRSQTEPIVEAFLKASQKKENLAQAEAKAKTNKLLRGLSIALAVAIMIAIGFATWAISQRDEAQINEKSAISARETSRANENVAQEAYRQAEQQAEILTCTLDEAFDEQGKVAVGVDISHCYAAATIQAGEFLDLVESIGSYLLITSTPIPTLTPTPTPTLTPTPTPTLTPTPTPTLTPTPTPTLTPTPTPTRPTPTPTLVPSSFGVMYTVNNTIVAVYPPWVDREEIGTASTNTCASTAITVTGDKYPLYRGGKRCTLGDRTVTCNSPDEQFRVVAEPEGQNTSLVIEPIGATGYFVDQGSINRSIGILWSPLSNRFIYLNQNEMRFGVPNQAGHHVATAPVGEPSFSNDGEQILYRSNSSYYIYNFADGSQTNITNSLGVPIECAAWYYGP